MLCVQHYLTTYKLWTGKRLLSGIEDVIEYTQNADRVWLIALGVESLELDPERLWPRRVKNVEVYTPGRDGRIAVRRVDLKRAE